MRAIFAVFKREVGLYFRSPIAYAIAFALLLFLGVLFNGYVVQANSRFPADPTFAPSLLTFLTFLIAPLLTMRLLAEEAREGTLEVLMTLPMNEAHFVIGKFFAAWAYFGFVILLTLVHVLILAAFGPIDVGRTIAMYLGGFLYGGAAIAVSMIWSAVTEDQVVAAFLGAVTVLVLYFADLASTALSGVNPQLGPGLASFVRELGLQAHYNSMAQGLIRAEDLLYFLFMIGGSIFISVLIVGSRRWRA